MTEYEEGFYYLITLTEEEPVLVHGYFCTDEGGKFGFGFNTHDGGGWIPLSDVTKETVIIPVTISSLDTDTVPHALKKLTQAMQDDPEFAWTWQSTIALSCITNGMGHGAANKAAANFMKWAFDIDMTLNEKYAKTQQVAIRDEIYEETVRLAVFLYRKHYADEVPDWEPASTTLGVLSQIDNMVMGIS